MYRTFDPEAWNVDTWFRRLKPGPKLLFIYLVTSPNAKASGAYEIDLDTITFQTGLTEDHVRVGFAALQQRITWFEEADHVFIHNFYKRQRLNASDTFRVAAARQAQTLPDEVRAVVFERYPELSDAPPPPPPKYKKRSDEGTVDTVSETGNRVVPTDKTPSPTLSENKDTLPPTLSPSNSISIRSRNRAETENREEIEPTVLAHAPRTPSAKQVTHMSIVLALQEACNWDTSRPATKRELARLHADAKEIADAGGTSEDVHARAENYIGRWGADKLTPTSLVGRWTECATTGPPRASPSNGHRPVTFEEQKQINNANAEAEFAAMLEGSKQDGAGAFQGTDEPPRRRLPG